MIGFRTLRHAAAVAALLSCMSAIGGETEPAAPDAELEEVIVTGELPGPAMWKVAKGDHTLWIMGTLSPLPAKMTWRSRRAEQAIASSEEILAGSRTRADVGTWTALRHMRAFLRLRHNSDGSTLRQALPEDVYARWLTAHQRWFGKDPDPKERARPLYAAEVLYAEALEKSGLSQQSIVWNSVRRMADEHKIRIRQREFLVEIKDVKGFIADIAAIPRDKEVACLVATLDYIDSELPDMKRRAAAWAVGDIARLRTLPRENARQSCYQDLLEKSQVREMVQKRAAEIRQDWSGIVDWMLLTHDTSFTTLSIQQLLDPQGPLAGLRARGYTVEEPRE
jgi:uncharacterized protein YbaP (TraB family)